MGFFAAVIDLFICFPAGHGRDISFSNAMTGPGHFGPLIYTSTFSNFLDIQFIPLISASELGRKL